MTEQNFGNRKVLLGSVLAFGLIAIAGCLEEIDFAKADAIDESIAIQGKIVKGSPSFVLVTIRGVFNFEDDTTFFTQDMYLLIYRLMLM